MHLTPVYFNNWTKNYATYIKIRINDESKCKEGFYSIISTMGLKKCLIQVYQMEEITKKK